MPVIFGRVLVNPAETSTRRSHQLSQEGAAFGEEECRRGLRLIEESSTDSVPSRVVPTFIWRRPNFPRIAILPLAACTICLSSISLVFHPPPRTFFPLCNLTSWSALTEGLMLGPLVPVSINTTHHSYPMRARRGRLDLDGVLSSRLLIQVE